MSGRKFRKMLMNWDLLVCDTVLGILVLVTFSGVIFRYLLNRPLEWLEEVQMMAIVWVVFLGAGAAFRECGHVAVEILVEMFPQKVQKILHILVSVLIVTVLAFLTVLSARYAGISLASGRRTGILRIPYYQIYGIIPIACVWMMVSHIYGEYRAGHKEDKSQDAARTVTEEEL